MYGATHSRRLIYRGPWEINETRKLLAKPDSSAMLIYEQNTDVCWLGGVFSAVSVVLIRRRVHEGSVHVVARVFLFKFELMGGLSVEQGRKTCELDLPDSVPV